MAPSATNEESRSSSQKPDKKHKREKSEHKKRPREEDEPAAADTTPRKTKKAKSEQKKSQPSKSVEFAVDSDSDGEAVTAHVAAPVTPVTPITPATPTASTTKEKKKKSSSKEKGSKDEDTESKKESKEESKKESKESKKSKKEDKESKKQDKESKKQDKESKKKDKESKKQDKESKKQDKESKKQDKESKKQDKESKKDHKKSKKHKKSQQEEETQDVTSTKQVAEADAMEVDLPDLSIRTKDNDRRNKKMDVAEVPLDPKFPFFRQTISIYVPLFPIGFDKPTTQMAEQHLEPLVNHYSTTIKGLLLNYSNVRVSDRPTESGPSIPTTDTTPTLLVSRDEYGVGFGWLTFDAFMFKPARGKWMEGVIQLQSEGYIGVVCWGRFNASIEAKRLPRTWKWIELDKPEGSDAGRDISDGEEGVTQMHTTGYWVDEKGSRIGGKVRFRIKNFDVGLSGDYGYLSIEGTFLDDAAEKALMMEEREEERRRRATVNPTGDLRPQTKPMPAFGVTKFGKDEEEELEDAQARAVYQRSRPVTPDA